MNRRDFLRALGLGAVAVAAEPLVEPVRRMWFVPSTAPVGSRVERLYGWDPGFGPDSTKRVVVDAFTGRVVAVDEYWRPSAAYSKWVSQPQPRVAESWVFKDGSRWEFRDDNDVEQRWAAEAAHHVNRPDRVNPHKLALQGVEFEPVRWVRGDAPAERVSITNELAASLIRGDWYSKG